MLTWSIRFVDGEVIASASEEEPSRWWDAIAKGKLVAPAALRVLSDDRLLFEVPADLFFHHYSVVAAFGASARVAIFGWRVNGRWVRVAVGPNGERTPTYCPTPPLDFVVGYV